MAVSDSKKAIELNPLYARAHFCLGICLERLSEDGMALDALSKAIELDEQNSVFLNSRAMLYDKLGFFDLCIKDFNKAIVLEPLNDALYHNRGVCAIPLLLDII
jgi:Flp pilus assembly protein TadD